MDKHLSNDEFFSRLADLFAGYKDKDHGSVFLVQKRLTYDQVKSETGEAKISEPLPILIRATNGHSKARRESKIKLSTIVDPSGLPSFFVKYAEVCKTGMIALKPRDRSKRKEKLKKRKKAAKEEA